MVRTERDRGVWGRRALVLVAVSLVVGVGAAPVALAQDELTADAGMSFTLAGPVGVIAVIIGIGGLVAGLIRRHRVVAKKTDAAAPATPVVPVPGPRQPVVTAAKGTVS